MLEPETKEVVEPRNLFKKRINLKPYEYPELEEFKNAIRHSYWLHTEFNFTADVQDFKINLTEVERSIITKTMLAISQIEVDVKTFWGNLYRYFPKPEIADVGQTFAESEVRHKDAYSFLIERLGMNKEFEKVKSIPALMGRINYMTSFLENKDKDNQNFVLSLVLFSLFIEHISLFSQFLIIMSFNRHKNLLRGISNAVEATSKEEEIHGRFGIKLFEIIRDEHPELLTDQFFSDLKDLANSAFLAEAEILDWIFEEGELDFLPKSVIENYIKVRYNNSMRSLGVEPYLSEDPTMTNMTKWFDEELLGTKELDFFAKRSTDYAKKMQSVSADDLF